MRTEARLKVSKACNITTTLSNLVTSLYKKVCYNCLKNTRTIRVFHTLPSVKNTRAERRVLKYTCSVNGKLKQAGSRRNIKRLYNITIRKRVFFTLMRKYACLLKSAKMMYWNFFIFLRVNKAPLFKLVL